MLKATVDIVQIYCVVFKFIVVRATVDIMQCYCVVFGVFVVTTTIDIVQWYCVLCGDYCGYFNSRYSAMLLCIVCSLLWLKQQ